MTSTNKLYDSMATLTFFGTFEMNSDLFLEVKTKPEVI